MVDEELTLFSSRINIILKRFSSTSGENSVMRKYNHTNIYTHYICLAIPRSYSVNFVVSINFSKKLNNVKSKGGGQRWLWLTGMTRLHPPNLSVSPQRAQAQSYNSEPKDVHAHFSDAPHIIAIKKFKK